MKISWEFASHMLIVVENFDISVMDTSVLKILLHSSIRV